MSKGPKAEKAVFDSVIDDDNLDFMTYMAEANQTDLTEIERTGCLSVGRDLKNNPLITMIPSMALGVADKPEAMFRKMLLLFLVKANEMVGTAYSVVYAHTTYDVMSQYPLIYRFYSILPRSYKKNIQKMYIIHPNVGIRMFFEFARIFLSQKFYSKLTLCETILDFQKVIPPTLVVIPLKFLRREDEERGLRYCNQMPPLSRSFDPALGTTRCLDVCMDYLRASGGVRAQGIFRIPGDEAELQLAKVRLQYACTGPAGPRICLSESRAAVIVGDIDSLYDTSTSPVSGSGSLKRGASSPKLSASLPAPSSTELPEEVPMCIAALTNMHTVAQVMKMSIRDLPEALVPEKTFADLVNITRRYDLQKLSIDWEAAVAAKLSTMPLEHLSTFVSVVNFLREVWGHSATNSMDAHNLSIVFAPTIFRSEVTDPIRAVMEVKLSQVLLEAVVTKHNILFYAIDLFKQSNPPGRAIPKVLAGNRPSLCTSISTDPCA